MAIISNAQDVSRWIEDHASGVDPAWAMNEALKKKIQLPPESKQFEGEKHKFLSFLDRYFKGAAGSRDQTVFQNTSTWDEVRAEAGIMREKYLNDKGPFGVRNRVFTKYASRVEFLTELIPSGDYMSPICGGLRLIISAARRHQTLVDVVLASLDTLFEVVGETATYIQLYARLPNVLPTAEDLYLAVLDAVEAILTWFEKLSKPGGSFRAGIKSIVHGEDYGSTLKAKITSNIENKSKAFDRAVKACYHQKIDDMARNVVKIASTNVADSRKREEEMWRLSAKCDRAFNASQTIEEQLHGIIKDLKGRVDYLENRDRQYLLDQQPRENKVFLKSLQPKVTDTQLLSALGFGSTAEAHHHALETVQRELDFVSLVGSSLGPHQQGRISFVMQNPAFREWFRSATSNVLVIRGMEFDATQSDVVSPLSYMCAMLAKTVSQVQNVQPAVFFCRLHSDPDGTLAGPRGMLRSLVSQLALSLSLAGQLDLSFLGEADLARIQGQGLEELWTLFEVIVKGLGSGFFFCMVDGVEFFDSEINIRGMHQVMHWMGDFVEEKERQLGGLTFKLLITSPIGSEYLRQWFPSAIEVALPGDHLNDSYSYDGL